jgi:GMP synthase-like glutamine amidotransferase
LAGCLVEKVTAHQLTEHLPQTFTTFHWHGDTFNLPADAIHLFKTTACTQQGFVYNDHVAGLQFHMEVKEDLLNGMTEHERDELVKADHVQTEEEIKQLTPNYITQQKEFVYTFLGKFIQL